MLAPAPQINARGRDVMVMTAKEVENFMEAPVSSPAASANGHYQRERLIPLLKGGSGFTDNLSTRRFAYGGFGAALFVSLMSWPNAELAMTSGTAPSAPALLFQYLAVGGFRRLLGFFRRGVAVQHSAAFGRERF